MASMTVKTYMSAAHVRTANGRACECCLRMDHGRQKPVRRSQKRRERQAWKRDVARGE